MKLLCLDSSGPMLSLACAEPGKGEAAWEGELPGRRSERLLPTVQSLLDKLQWQAGQLDAVAVSRGPGSFTGLRVSLAFAKGLALDGVRLYSESTLEVWAQTLAPALQAHGGEELGVILDARRGQVFKAHFRREGHGWTSVSKPEMLDLKDALASLESLPLCGDIAPPSGAAAWLPRQRPLAEGLAELVLPRLETETGEEAALLQPDYLRRPEVEILWDKRQAEKKA